MPSALCSPEPAATAQYKRDTLHRRIERRMAIHQIETISGYVRYVQKTPEEVNALFNDLLIGVTSFFRDSEAFKALEEQGVPQLFAGKTADDVIRVWVPECSSGEEAYSIAILLAERQAAMKQSFKVQVFATDIDADLRRRAEEAGQGGQPSWRKTSRACRLLKFGGDSTNCVHQIELEMQNVELRRAQTALAASQARYFDLYNMAPVGYCTVSEQGLLTEANLNAATLLGLSRGALVGQRFSQFIAPEDQDVFYLLRRQLFANSFPQICELRMVQGVRPSGRICQSPLAKTKAARL